MRRHDRFRSSSLTMAVLGAGVAVILALIIFSPATHGPGRRTGPQEAGATPSAEESGIPAVNPAIEAGPLQRGITPTPDAVHLTLETEDDFPGFRTHQFQVEPGQVVVLTFTNASKPEFHYLHNWVLVKPGTQHVVGKAARLAGPTREWIPESPDVLAFGWVQRPGQSEQIVFRAPEEEGDYPFLCAFPGHYLQEHGVLRVRRK